MIVIDVHHDSGEPAKPWPDAPDAPLDQRVPISEAIDEPMEPDSGLYLRRQQCDFRVPCEVGDDPAEHQFRIGSSQVQMGQEVQRNLPESEYALGGGHPATAWVGFDSGTQRTGTGLEDGFDNMVRIAAMVEQNMECEKPTRGDGPPKFFGQLRGKGSECFQWHIGSPDQKRSAAQINSGGCQRLIHGKSAFTKATDARFIAQGRDQRLPEADPDIFHGVVSIDVRIAGTGHTEIEETVAGNVREHVVEEADTRRNRTLPGTIEVEHELDRRFGGVPVNLGNTRHDF